MFQQYVYTQKTAKFSGAPPLTRDCVELSGLRPKPRDCVELVGRPSRRRPRSRLAGTLESPHFYAACTIASRHHVYTVIQAGYPGYRVEKLTG